MLFGRKASVAPQADHSQILSELRALHDTVSKLNIPVVEDDHDAGYDTAIDEVLDIISERIKIHASK